MSKSLHPYYLHHMGIDTWTTRTTDSVAFKLMVIGEVLDDKLFNFFKKMLASIALSIDDVCFKSVHEDNLLQQIKTNSAPLLLVLGESAAHLLFHQPLNKVRGQLLMLNNISTIVSYHPFDLLKNPMNKKMAYQDLLFIQHVLS